MSETSDLALFIGRFHPVLVHLPIGFLVLLGVMEGLSRWRRFESVNANAGFVLALAVPGSILSVVCGWLLSTAGGYDERLLQLHFWSGIATAGATLLAAILYLAKVHTLYRLTVFASLGLLLVASHHGGSLTHGSDYLVRYAPEPIASWFGKKPRQLKVQEFTAAGGEITPAEASAYASVVHPVMDRYCVSCHGPEKSKGDLRLDTYETLLAGGSSGPGAVAGNAADSELIKRILLPLDSDEHMPPDGKPQPSADEVALLRWWIDAGASADAPVSKLKTSPAISGILSRQLGAQLPEISEEVPAMEILPRAEAVARAEALSAELEVPITALSEAEPWLQCNASIAGPQFTDEHLSRLAAVRPNLRWLDLAGTSVTDAGLVQFSEMPNLVRLYLQRTAITDDGLKQLEKLKNLEYLNLYGTQVTDSGLKNLNGIPKLRQLYLWQTQVTPEGVTAFAESRIDREQLRLWEEEIESLKKRIREAHVEVNLGLQTSSQAAVGKGPINSLCPVSGKPVDKQRTSTFDGNPVAFCCADCKGTFDKDPKPFLARLDISEPASTVARAPVNSECPVSGKTVDSSRTLLYEGRLVAFCCDSCKAKFESDPKPFLEKLPPASSESPATAALPVNSLCPVSGKEANAQHSIDHAGQRILFCCADCKASFLKDPEAYLAKLNSSK